MMLVDRVPCISLAVSTLTGVGEFFLSTLPVRPVTITSLSMAEFSFSTKSRRPAAARFTCCVMFSCPRKLTCMVVVSCGRSGGSSGSAG